VVAETETETETARGINSLRAAFGSCGFGNPLSAAWQRASSWGWRWKLWEEGVPPRSKWTMRRRRSKTSWLLPSAPRSLAYTG